MASVIAGATKPEQVRANVAAVDWKLSDNDLAALDRLLGASDES
jgi:aryl-alcohol dehydrogenase-like predicted oxidoreductase